MAAALWRTIGELRMAELSGDNLVEGAFENPTKRGELRALLGSYETRPGRALLGFLDWVESGFPASTLRRLFQSGDLSLKFDEGPSPGQAARLLARAGTTWGRATYLDTLAALALSDRERAAEPDAEPEDSERWLTRASHTEQLRHWFNGLLARIPDASGGGATALGDVVAAAKWFVATHANVTSSVDSTAVSVITVALDQLDLLDDVRRPLRDSVKLIRSILDGPTVGSDRARPGHLYVTNLTRAGWTGRSCTFVVGLEEGRVFPTHVEDPVLLDDERRQIDPRLATSADRASEAVHAVVSRLVAIGITVPGASVTLSYSCRDLRQYRTTFPSWVLLQAYRLGVTDTVTFEELIKDLGEPENPWRYRSATRHSVYAGELTGLTKLGSTSTRSSTTRPAATSGMTMAACSEVVVCCSTPCTDSRRPAYCETSTVRLA